MVETITLSKAELDWSRTHATAIVDYYGGEGSRGSGSYNHNKVSSNLIGVKSEVAIVKWFRFKKVSPIVENFKNFRDKSLVGDLQVLEALVPLEVKGLRPHQWAKFQRMIPPNQLKKYVREGSFVIWTTTTGDTKSGEVKLRGWNYAWEVSEFGVFKKTICDNIWLEDSEMMRPMSSLLEHLDNPITEW